MVDRINRKFGRQFSKQVLENTLQKASSLRPSFSLSRALAFILASVVHLTTLIFVVGGALLLYLGWPNFILVFLGLLCLAIAIATRPRFGSVPENILSPDEFPRIYELIQQLAADLGLKKVDGIVIDDSFNASFSRLGIRGRVYITIGFPLYFVLTHEEQTALLAHEIGHGINGDAQRGVFVHTAVQALQTWYEFLMPESLFSSEDGIAGIFMVPMNILLLGMAKLVELYLHLLLFLLFRESQRAEYLADQVASKAAGSNAVISLLEKFYWDGAYNMACQRTALNKGKSLLKELTNEIKAMPQHEKERLHRLSVITSSTIDATHPPTPYRIEFIKQHGFETNQPMLSEMQSREIWTELSTLREAVEKAAIDNYRNRLYS